MSERNMLALGVAKENTTIRLYYTEEELADMRKSFADKSIDLQQLKNEIDAIKKDYKDKMSPLSKELTQLLDSVTKKYADIKMDVVLVPDEESRSMEQYHPETGQLLSKRPMTNDEKRHYTVLDRLPGASVPSQQ